MTDPGFQELYEREFAAVFRAAVLVCGDTAEAEDAAQEAFARALVRWRRLSREPWAAGWVMTTAMNLARRAKRRPAPNPDASPNSPVDHDARIDLRAAIRALPARQQEAVALHYLLDLSVAEAASAMEVSEGTVKTHLARARESLGRELRESGTRDGETGEPASDRSEDAPPAAKIKRRANDG